MSSQSLTPLRGPKEPRNRPAPDIAQLGFAQGSLKDLHFAYLKHCLFNKKYIVGNHNLQVAMFRCFSCIRIPVALVLLLWVPFAFHVIPTETNHPPRLLQSFFGSLVRGSHGLGALPGAITQEDPAAEHLGRGNSDTGTPNGLPVPNVEPWTKTVLRSVSKWVVFNLDPYPFGHG